MYLKKFYLPILLIMSATLLVFMLSITPEETNPVLDRTARISLLCLTIFGLILAWSGEFREALGRWLTAFVRMATTGWFAFLGYAIWLDGGLHW